MIYANLERGVMRMLGIAFTLTMSLCVPALALRDTAEGTITKSDDTKMVVVFGDPEKNGVEKAVVSGSCQMHWGLLSFGPDGSAIWKFEVSSSFGATERWQGQFLLYDKQDNSVGTVPSSGVFEVEIKGPQPREMEIVIPLKFSPDLFQKISSVKMTMECEPKEA